MTRAGLAPRGVFRRSEELYRLKNPLDERPVCVERELMEEGAWPRVARDPVVRPGRVTWPRRVLYGFQCWPVDRRGVDRAEDPERVRWEAGVPRRVNRFRLSLP